MRVLPSAAAVLGIMGAACVAFGLPLEANVIWVFGNSLMIVHLIKIGEPELVTMFAVYLLIAVFGVVHLTGVI